MFENSDQHAMIDLHGLSLIDAEHLVCYWLAKASSMGIMQLRIVTGRGNHVNARGERGVLYQALPGWLDNSPYKESVAQYQAYDGYYELIFKSISEKSTRDHGFATEFDTWLMENRGLIKEQANLGNIGAQMLYAGFLERGEGVKQDFKKAVKFYRLAAEQNHAPAMHILARCYLHGTGLRQNDEQALLWLEKADVLNYAESTVSLGDSHFYGRGTAIDHKKAVGYYAKAVARHQHPVAMRKLANAYKNGIGIPENQTQALQWYKKAAEAGDTIAQYNMGCIYKVGNGTERNEQQAFFYWQLAAERGDPDAQLALGGCYWDGLGVEKNEEQALVWLRKAAAHGSSQANDFLRTVTHDQAELEQCLRRSSEAGNFLAAMSIAYSANLSAEELQKRWQSSLRNAFKLAYNDIILLESKPKFLLLDTMLSHKKTSYRDKALRIIQDMAEQSCIFSLRRLAMFYLEGNSELQIVADVPRAIGYLKRAIALHDSKSMLRLAYLYRAAGIAEQQEQALGLYQQALSHHNPEAYYQMAIMVIEGSLGRVNLRQAMGYLESAIAYEQQPEHLRFLCSGIIDKYHPISAAAKAMLDRLDAQGYTHFGLFTPLAETAVRSKPVEQKKVSEPIAETAEQINDPGVSRCSMM